MTFGRQELTLLMRSLLRSLPDTPPRERQVHKRVYDKLSEEVVRLTPRRTTAALGRALDRMIGR
jgi:hypothetical protein